MLFRFDILFNFLVSLIRYFCDFFSYRFGFVLLLFVSLPPPGGIAIRCVCWCVCVCVCVFLCSFVNMCRGRISRKRLEIETHTMEPLYEMAYGKSNGHVMDDVTWSVAGGRRCTRLAEVEVSDCFSIVRPCQLPLKVSNGSNNCPHALYRSKFTAALRGFPATARLSRSLSFR